MLGSSKPPMRHPFFPSIVAVVALGFAVGGCGRTDAEYQQLLAENARLRAELAKALNPGADKDKIDPQSAAADLILTMDELWPQRFEDLPFRAEQRLSKKILRLTGMIENVSEGSLTIRGNGTGMRMQVNLAEAYAKKVQAGLTNLEPGTPATVQGRFIFDRMWLNDAVIVEKATGRTLSSEEVESLGIRSDPKATAGDGQAVK
jgi:hypothetical protein